MPNKFEDPMAQLAKMAADSGVSQEKFDALGSKPAAMEAQAPQAAEFNTQVVEPAKVEAPKPVELRTEAPVAGAGAERQRMPTAELAELRREQVTVAIGRLKGGIKAKLSSLGSRLLTFGFKMMAGAENVTLDTREAAVEMSAAAKNLAAGAAAETMRVATVVKETVVEAGVAAKDKTVEAAKTVGRGVQVGAEVALGMGVVAVEGAVKLGQKGMEASKAAYGRAVEGATKGYQELSARGEKAFATFRERGAASRASMFEKLASFAARRQEAAQMKRAEHLNKISGAEDKLARFRGESLPQAA